MNIVILEDEAIMMMFLKATLEEKGHKVIGIFNSHEGFFELIKKENIDLVFMDIQIEGALDGTQIAVKLRQIDENIKIVFVTSFKDSQTMQMAKESKPNGYLIKPVSKEDLEAILMVCEIDNQKVKYDNNINIATYQVDLENRTVKENEELIKLTKKELLCFEILLKNKNNHISHEHLVHAIWNEDLNTKANSLRELVYRIRKKLPNLTIENSVNIGYILK